MNGRVFRRGKTWSYIVDVGAHGDGRRRQQMKGGFATKRDADRALRELLRTLDTGTYVAASSLTLGGFLADEWLPAMRPPTLRATTWTEYARKVRCHVIPRLGQIPLQRLSPAHLNAFYAELITAGRVDGTGGLSPKTVREIHVIVRKALKDAVRWGRVNRNVAALADPPSQRSAAASRRRTMRTWTPAQLRRFLSEDLDERLGYAWVLAGTTGLRRSELLGLRWADVDLTAARLAVRQRLANVDGHPELSEPKSNRSGRVVDLDERTVAALRARRTQQAEHRLMCGPAWHDLDLVVTREDGLWIHRLVQRAVPPAGRRARPSQDPAARSPAHARDAAAAGRRKRQDRLRATWSPLGRLHPRHLRPRHPRHAVRRRPAPLRAHRRPRRRPQP